MRICFLIVASLLALFDAATANADVTVRVGIGQASCNYPTIQQAINAASNANGQTIILITRSQAYNNQQLDINGKNVTLRGGFADCDQTVPDALHTSLNGLATTSRPVISVRGSTNYVSFEYLDIRNNGNTGASPGAGFGGAAAISGGPHTLVEFANASIDANTANYGGGLYVQNTSAGAVNLLVAENTSISNNDGLLSGGGIWCSNANVYMTFQNSAIFVNRTGGSGGGIRAENCTVEIASAIPGIGSVAFNTSTGNGGGLSVTGQASSTRIYTRNDGNATSVQNNISHGLGGAIAIEGGAQVQVWDAIVETNVAGLGGGAVYLFNGGDTFESTFAMRGDTVGAPMGTFPSATAATCSLAMRCNRISSNQAGENGGAPRDGAAILAISSAVEDGQGGLNFHLRGTEVSLNTGSNLIDIDGRYATSTLSGVAIFGNTNSATNMINVTAPTVAGGDVSSTFFVHGATIAGNIAAGTSTIVKNAGVQLEFKRSVHWQPGKRVKSGLGAQIASDIEYVVANDLAGLPPSIRNLQADPLFVSPVTSDFHLRLASPAVDFATQSSDATADHLPRHVDLPGVVDEFGDQDVGAYERQDACGDGSDRIFCSGFET